MNIIKRAIRWLDREINYLFYRRLRYARTVRRHLAKFYTDDQPPATNDRKMIVYMADGVIYRSGFADRMRAMITLYDYCKKNDLDFRINFTDPFRLEDYLLPAQYDWRLKPGELSKNKRTSRPFFVDTRHEEDSPRERRWEEATFRHYFLKRFKQAHVYTIFYYADKNFPTLFSELFKLSPELERRVEECVRKLGENYISVSTRFLELLGDFTEPKPMARPLDEDEQQNLIANCLQQIRRIHNEECIDGERILVTSDSAKFLEAARALPYVKVIEGKIGHLSVKQDNRREMDYKTLTDFFTISRARKSYLLISGGMYRSNFSKRATQIGNHEFIEVRF